MDKLIKYLILHWFYLRHQIALIGYFFCYIVYTITDQDMVFLVPDWCWAKVRNGTSISVDVIENTTKIIQTHVSALFRQIVSCFVVFDIAGQSQCMYIVRKYQINLHSLRNRAEKLKQILVFLPVSKNRTSKFYIFQQCMYVYCLFMYH